jgi:hypothetical protein
MQALTDEVIEELTDKDEEAVGIFMEQMGQVIAWIGHGDNDQLPEPIRQFAEDIQPPIPIEVLLGSERTHIRTDTGSR